MIAGKNSEDVASREIVLSRLFDAPRELVFDAFTDAKHLGEWWGPKGYSVSTIEADIRVGGMWRFTMTGPNGMVWPSRIIYEEIARPERILFTNGYDKEPAEDPERFHVTITFVDKGGKTEVTMRSLMPTAAQRERVVGFGAIELGKTTLEKLARHLQSMM